MKKMRRSNNLMDRIEQEQKKDHWEIHDLDTGKKVVVPDTENLNPYLVDGHRYRFRKVSSNFCKGSL